MATYFGPCPPASVGWHHYALTLLATDIEPAAAAAGLTREEMVAALKGHVKGSSSVILRFKASLGLTFAPTLSPRGEGKRVQCALQKLRNGT